jgi:hypothetical protein
MKTKMLLIEDAMLNEVVGGLASYPTTYYVVNGGNLLYQFTPKSPIDPKLLTCVDTFLAKFNINISTLPPDGGYNG